jgi:hypothetical protein
MAGIEYFAFCRSKPAGSADIMTLAIAHRLRDKVIVDAVRQNKRTASVFAGERRRGACRTAQATSDRQSCR